MSSERLPMAVAGCKVKVVEKEKGERIGVVMENGFNVALSERNVFGNIFIPGKRLVIFFVREEDADVVDWALGYGEDS